LGAALVAWLRISNARLSLGVVKSEPLHKIESGEGVRIFEQAIVPLNFDDLEE
jgi:hypothetical protein